MDKFANHFFSMRMMTVAMFIFLAVIAGATFMESAYDVQTAKLFIYNALWFNLLLTYLALNLIANIIRYRMVQLKKWSVLLFHVSFIVILIGAGVTRFFSFEGVMRVPEGKTANFIYSSNPYLSYVITDKKDLQLSNEYPMYLSELDWYNDFSYDQTYPGRSGNIRIEYVDFQKNMIDSMVTNDSIKESALEIVHLGESKFIGENGFLMLDNVPFSFEKRDAMPGVEFFKKGNIIQMKVAYTGGKSLPMSTLRASDRNREIPDSLYKPIPIDTLVQLEAATLYQVGAAQFVFKGIKKHTKNVRMKAKEKGAGLDDLIVKVTHENVSKLVTLTGGIGSLPAPVEVKINGLYYTFVYGPKMIEIPFEVGCRDFRLERYPGSNMASSFESDLEILDKKNSFNKKYTLSMNHVIDYGGYRFFQSSYFQDESGTILSVNHDALGTGITYIGYLLMTLGMVLSLFVKNGRMRELVRLLSKSSERRSKLELPIVAALFMSSLAFGQTTAVEEVDHSGHDHAIVGDSLAASGDSIGVDTVIQAHAHEQQAAEPARPQGPPIHRIMSEKVSDELAKVLVQDFSGRIIPMHTFCDQILRKLHRSNTFDGKNAVQLVVSMHMYPEYWMRNEHIYVESKGGIRDRFKGREYVSLIDLTDTLTGQFIFMAEYQKAFQKKESERDEFDKKLIKLGERFSVMNDIALWSMMKIIPLKSDPANTWFVPLSPDLAKEGQNGSKLSLEMFSAIDRSVRENSDSEVLGLIKKFVDFQYAEGGDVCPSREDVAMEIRYNEMNIFGRSAKYYGLIGFSLFILFFVAIFVRPNSKTKKVVRWISYLLLAVVVVTFLFHGYGIYMRAMITGYAPWSNGYEAIVFIGFVTMFSGFFLIKKYPVVVAGAAILTFMMLFVSEMNLLDPEITPLQPVLKSYWLMIHVAIITGSYAPLGISFILGFFALILYIVRNKKNAEIVNININELTYLSEIFMTIGVFMLTIGTFLGGVWANESWGRYWGWDPKETWALVAVLVYAIILHVRYIPGMKGKFLFNVLGMWGYSSILFTFFGVNFYLVGLHSYAQGDSMAALPNWVIITFWLFVAFTVVAGLRNRAYKKAMKENNDEL